MGLVNGNSHVAKSLCRLDLQLQHSNCNDFRFQMFPQGLCGHVTHTVKKTQHLFLFVLFYFILLILKLSTAHSHTDREEDPALEDDIYIQHAETRRDEISCGKRDAING